MLNIDSFIGLAWLRCSKMWLEFRIERISTFIGKPENLELTDVLLLVLTCRHCRPWDKWELLCSSLILFILMLTFTFNHTSIVNWIIHLWSFARISIPFLSFVKLPHCKRAAKTKKKERKKERKKEERTKRQSAYVRHWLTVMTQGIVSFPPDVGTSSVLISPYRIVSSQVISRRVKE